MTEWHISLGRVKENTAHVVYAKTFNTSQLESEQVQEILDDATRKIVVLDRAKVAEHDAKQLKQLEDLQKSMGKKAEETAEEEEKK